MFVRPLRSEIAGDKSRTRTGNDDRVAQAQSGDEKKKKVFECDRYRIIRTGSTIPLLFLLAEVPALSNSVQMQVQ